MLGVGMSSLARPQRCSAHQFRGDGAILVRGGRRRGLYHRIVGDYAQTLVDIDIDDDIAVRMRDRVITWLVERGIIAAELTDCVLGSPEGGYAPGQNYGQAVGYESAAIPRYRTNGMVIVAGRRGYWGGDLEAVICPRCTHRESLEPIDEGRWHTDFSAAIDQWCAGGDGLVRCVGCGMSIGLNDWDWGYPWAFSALGITFWNWDDLSETFIAELSEFLGGHRLIYCHYKL